MFPISVSAHLLNLSDRELRAMTAAKVGKGWVVLLGTFPEEEELIRIY